MGVVPPTGLAVDSAKGAARGFVGAAAATLRPADWVQLYYNVAMVALLLAWWPHNGGVSGSVLQNVALLVLVPWLASGSASSRTWRRELADWYHVPAVLFSFKQLAIVVPLINPHDRDSVLAGIDHALFGTDPIVWLERLYHPAATEILQVCYCVFYVLPVVLFVRLKYRGMRRAFDFGLFSVLGCFYLTYVGYLSVPALGPRYLLGDAAGSPLQGVLMFDAIRHGLDAVEGVMRDCFPSGHTAVTLLVLWLAARSDRMIYRIFLVPSIGLIISTVYLRYHYVIDVLAGIGFTLLVIAVAPWLFDRLERLKDNRPAASSEERR